MTRAYGIASHVEGWQSQTTVYGAYAHAEGNNTTASNIGAHSEGAFTQASGLYSHAQGWYTTASADASHACGAYSLADVAGQIAGSGGLANVAGSQGSQQFSLFSLAAYTTDPGAPPSSVVMEVGPATWPATERLVIRQNMTYSMKVYVSARQIGGTAGTVGDSVFFEGQCMLKRDGANNTSLVCTTPSLPQIESDAGAAAWTAVLSADDANEALSITVTGDTDKNIAWHATIISSEAGV
jgi:hypothetical protein